MQIFPHSEELQREALLLVFLIYLHQVKGYSTSSILVAF